MICSDILHKYHSGYFKIVSNFTRLTAREITYNNFEISLVVFIPNITTNHAITYTNIMCKVRIENIPLHCRVQKNKSQNWPSPKVSIKHENENSKFYKLPTLN